MLCPARARVYTAMLSTVPTMNRHRCPVVGPLTLKHAHAVHETRAREMEQVLDFFERRGVPDKEHIVDCSSDLVWQPGSNAEIIYRRAGGSVNPKSKALLAALHARYRRLAAFPRYQCWIPSHSARCHLSAACKRPVCVTMCLQEALPRQMRQRTVCLVRYMIMPSLASCFAPMCFDVPCRPPARQNSYAADLPTHPHLTRSALARLHPSCVASAMQLLYK